MPDRTLMARLQLSASGVGWAASLLKPWQFEGTEGEWSAHQNVFHLLANERIFQHRIGRILAEDRPLFQRWDSAGYMRVNYSRDPDIEALAAEFVAARAKTYETFKSLDPAQWARCGEWPDGRKVDLAWLAEKVLWHALDHFASLLDLHGDFAPLQGGG